MSQRWVACVTLLLLALPSVLAHGGVEDEDRYYANQPASAAQPRDVVVPEGYTGPSRDPYLSYFEGVWLYGTVSATPLAKQWPVDIDVDGDWAVWEDANRSDIYAYNIPAGQGFYVTTDNAQQHHPHVSNNVVIFSDYRNHNIPAVHAYFLDTGETRPLSNATRSVRDADIDYPLVAWIDDNTTNPDAWVYSLLNNTGWNIHPGTDRDSEPVVIGDRVYWRTYRYNLWDIMGYDTRLEETVQVTTDNSIQTAPFSNGKDLLFLTNLYDLGWVLDRFDSTDEVVRHTNVRMPDSSQNSASGDALLRVALDVEFSELVVRNLTSGATTHVSGNLLLTSPPTILGHTVFAPARTRDGVSLLMLDVSPFAFAKRPSLTLIYPTSNTPWTHPMAATGVLDTGTPFTEPATFTYRVDDLAPQLIPTAKQWRFTLDPADAEPGTHVLTIRATFREGPPVTTSVVLIVPAPSDTVDVERLGPAYHAARLVNTAHNYVLDNPASWVLIPLMLLILILVGIRLWLWLKPRRRRSLVEYVAPDDM